MIEGIIATVIIGIGLSLVYILKNLKTEKANYIWVGPGKNPFEKRSL